MTTSAETTRRPPGRAVLALGFRPFFLLGAIWAALAMALWIGTLGGAITLPTRFDPVSWHAHALLFGYLGAVLAGFLLTALPNWTGRPPVTGWPLAALAGLWVAGRVAVGTSLYLTPMTAALIDLAFPVALALVALREIVAGRNWRNLMVVALLAVFGLGNALFHAEAARGAYAAQGTGLRLGLAAAVMMVALIGGRIVPAFTRNWLSRQPTEARPAPPMQGFDKLVLLASLAGLALWIVRPQADAAGLALLVLAGLQTARLARWQGLRTTREPLIWVLHLAYAMLPLGALALGLAILAPGWLSPAAGQHVWTAGAIGLMTLAVMTRASLGHTGRPLSAGPGTAALYVLILGTVAARLAAGIWPGMAQPLYHLSAGLWIAAFVGFALLYGPLLVTPRSDTR